jgi:SPP1 family predicted phage head-tail adaptor
MRAGNLRHQIVIEQRSATQDSFGGLPETWSTLKTVYAEIQPLSGREKEAAQAINVDISHQINIRYQSAFADPRVTAAYRVRFGSRLFNIHASMNVDERNQEITLLASEGMNIE